MHTHNVRQILHTHCLCCAASCRALEYHTFMSYYSAVAATARRLMRDALQQDVRTSRHTRQCDIAKCHKQRARHVRIDRCRTPPSFLASKICTSETGTLLHHTIHTYRKSGSYSPWFDIRVPHISITLQVVKVLRTPET